MCYPIDPVNFTQVLVLIGFVLAVGTYLRHAAPYRD